MFENIARSSMIQILQYIMFLLLHFFNGNKDATPIATVKTVLSQYVINMLSLHCTFMSYNTISHTPKSAIP